MQFHDGERRVNKLDGGKGDAKQRFHKALRKAGNRSARAEHWLLCDDCGEGIRECGCDRTEDHYGAFMPHPEYRRPKIYPTLCSNCEWEREKLKEGYQP